MRALQFIGGSYALENRKADCQRTINMYVAALESGSGKAPLILKSMPGLVTITQTSGEIRGAKAVGSRLFVVAGADLLEVLPDWTTSPRGALSTTTGPIEMEANVAQLIIVDGPGGYFMDLTTNTFATIGGTFYGSTRVSYLDGYAIFIRPNTSQFYWSELNDVTNLPALSFASAEGTPGNIVSQVADHRELWLFKSDSIEVWVNTGSEAVFERNGGAFMEHGCAAAHSAQKLDNSVFWVGSDDLGNGIVWRAQGYTPVRVSNNALEQVLQASSDISGCRAYTYQQDGHSFYVLQIPGAETTWAFDVATGVWCERAELVAGQFAPHRGLCHVFSRGWHILGDASGRLYRLDPNVNNNAGDVLTRDRISPHFATPTYEELSFPLVHLDCQVGEGKPDGTAPQVMLRYSNDGGHEFGPWRTASAGAIGKRRARVRYWRCGHSDDRVWHVRMTDDAPLDIVGVNIRTGED